MWIVAGAMLWIVIGFLTMVLLSAVARRIRRGPKSPDAQLSSACNRRFGDGMADA